MVDDRINNHLSDSSPIELCGIFEDNGLSKLCTTLNTNSSLPSQSSCSSTLNDRSCSSCTIVPDICTSMDDGKIITRKGYLVTCDINSDISSVYHQCGTKVIPVESIPNNTSDSINSSSSDIMTFHHNAMVFATALFIWCSLFVALLLVLRRLSKQDSKRIVKGQLAQLMQCFDPSVDDSTYSSYNEDVIDENRIDNNDIEAELLTTALIYAPNEKLDHKINDHNVCNDHHLYNDHSNQKYSSKQIVDYIRNSIQSNADDWKQISTLLNKLRCQDNSDNKNNNNNETVGEQNNHENTNNITDMSTTINECHDVILNEIQKKWNTNDKNNNNFYPNGRNNYYRSAQPSSSETFSRLLNDWMREEPNNIDCRQLRAKAYILWALHDQQQQREKQQEQYQNNHQNDTKSNDDDDISSSLLVYNLRLELAHRELMEARKIINPNEDTNDDPINLDIDGRLSFLLLI